MPVMMIGEARIDRVEELRIPNKISYFTHDEELIAANRHWLQPHFLDDEGHFDLVFQSFIIEVGGRVVLLDPCTGNGKLHPVPFFDMLEVPWIERIHDCGYRPEDIDFVVCTHLHHDHCGWNTMLRDGKWVPTFARARYIMQQVEYDSWRAADRELPPDHLNIGVFERSVDPVVRAGLVDFASGSRRLTPELSVEIAPGHTFGHQLLRLESAGEKAFFTGDCYHHPIQLVQPSMMFGDCDDQQKLVETRRRIVELSVTHNAPLIAAHACAPYAVRAMRGDDRVLHFATGV
ncbi:MAG: MBL fold metallo-hydrolase [Novosphingobium sp.]